MIDPPLDPELFAFLARRAYHDPTNDLVRIGVSLRAGDACEYCLNPTRDDFQIDHIIPEQRWNAYSMGRLHHLLPDPTRRGPHHLDNYAWSCSHCNRVKWNTVGRRVEQTYVRLFDPRRDVWPEHFVFFHHYVLIQGISLIGRATERTLKFNDARIGGPIGPRHEAILAGTFPPPWARGWHASQGHT